MDDNMVRETKRIDEEIYSAEWAELIQSAIDSHKIKNPRTLDFLKSVRDFCLRRKYITAKQVYYCMKHVMRAFPLMKGEDFPSLGVHKKVAKGLETYRDKKVINPFEEFLK